ncbi:hypothetical protein PTKIN_Ptkin08bG0020200 [Pterospermum kingtungense]
MVSKGFITPKDIEDAKSIKGSNVVSVGLPAYCRLLAVWCSTNANTSGILFSNFCSSYAAPKEEQVVEEIYDHGANKAENLTEEEEDYLGKLFLLCGDPARLKVSNIGSPPESERKRAELDAIARRNVEIKKVPKRNITGQIDCFTVKFKLQASSNIMFALVLLKLEGTEQEEESLVEGLKNVILEENGEKHYQYPLRPHDEDCSFYLKTGKCKFGLNCKFNHPVERVQYGKGGRYSRSKKKSTLHQPDLNVLGLPIRMLVKDCPYYMRTGSCGYGSNCIFNHPDLTAEGSNSKLHHPKARPSKPTGFSSSGLPLRPDRKICRSYEKIGICKYGRSCCFHHPEDFDDSL